MSKYPIFEVENITLSVAVAQYLPKVSWSLRDANHPTWLFFWNPAGVVRLIFNGEVMVIGQEHAVLLPPFTKISAYSDEAFPHLYAHFKTPEGFNGVRRRPFLLPPYPVRKFFADRRYQPPQWRSAVHWQLLLWEYLMMLAPEDFVETSSDTPPDERIAVAVQLCERRASNPPDNAALARSAGMSINNFYRLFRREMGISPRRYREGLRLDFARRMLLESDAKISAVAQQCGYADRYQFSKAFKKYFGLTPAAVRMFR